LRISLMRYGPASVSSAGPVYENYFAFLRRGGRMKRNIGRRGWSI